MTAHLDLTLPDYVSEMEPYDDKPSKDLPFAFYTLCELDDTKTEAYRRLCSLGTQELLEVHEDIVQLPPKVHFLNEPLSSIVKYHIDLAAQDLFDPYQFIVCVYAESRTVLLVTLSNDGDCKPDSFWTRIEDTGNHVANLQIGNVEWDEYKENRAEGPDFQPPVVESDEEYAARLKRREPDAEGVIHLPGGEIHP